jgi:flagellar hook protein FlgE
VQEARISILVRGVIIQGASETLHHAGLNLTAPPPNLPIAALANTEALMGMTSLGTGLSGLAANQSKLDVVGNNIANVNTVGFKSSRLDFKTQFSESFSYGTPPSGNLGGTNPLQVGLGTQQGSITRDFNDGSREVTGVSTHMALEGNGFFILQGQDQVYTRDGTFRLNSQNNLVNADGMLVQGFGVDANFQPIPGVLGNINIPLGGLTIAQATANVTFSGNLNAGGVAATSVANITSASSLYLAPAGVVDPVNPPTGTTLLTDLGDATGTNFFQSGDIISASGTKGGRTLSPKTLTVTATTTLQDYQDFLQGSLGIDMTAGINGTASAPGVSLNTTSNTVDLNINGNFGVQNDLAMSSTAITVDRAGVTNTPFAWTKNGSANGESVFTSLQAYDSLGNPITTNVIATLVSASSAGTTWQFFAESPDDTSTAPVASAVGRGTLSFNNSGQLTSATTPNVVINRSGTGSSANLSFALDFTKVTSLSGNNSSLASTLQDGSPMGSLSNFSIGNDGTITGTFTNGLTRALGQVAVATFQNNQGLVDRGDNSWSAGPNSGTAVISAPQQFSAGRIISGALEQSNVDLSAEFVNLISASSGFSAASRVISTSNQLLQELLNTSR